MFKIEVLSDEGWSRIESFNVADSENSVMLKTQFNTLNCTEDHIVIDSDGNELFAKDSLLKTIKTKNGIERVSSVETSDEKIEVYDLSLASDTNHTFYVNRILSHNCVILDEFAFLQKNIADKLFTSMYPVISSSKNGKFILVSTPNGTDNLYYDVWQQANSKEIGKNLEGWKAFTMYWWQVPGHDEKWKEKQIAAIGAQRFAQEFNNEFLANSSTKKLVPDDILEKYRIRLSEYKTNGIKSKKQRIISE